MNGLMTEQMQLSFLVAADVSWKKTKGNKFFDADAITFERKSASACE